MSAQKIEPAENTEPSDDKILAARTLLEIDERLGETSRPEVVALASMTMEQERRRARPIVDPTDAQILGARLVLELDQRLDDVSDPHRVALAALPTSSERRAHDS